MLERLGGLREVELQREGTRSSKGVLTRYVWGNASPQAIGLSLRSGSYVSHSSAMFVLGLTDQVPKTIYVNREQSPKPHQRGRLTQPAIDRAFSGRPRSSTYVYTGEGYRYVLLSGKQTGRLGVARSRLPTGEEIDATGLERTLIDVVVRPGYGGGPGEILAAYRLARERVSVRKLLTILDKLEYTYPYHQSVGFLMERAGYDEDFLKQLLNYEIKWNFYLDYGLKDADYSERWRLFYPKGL